VGATLTNGGPLASAGVDALVRAARQGDHDAFGQLYQRFSRVVHGVLVARLPYEAAEDLIQDVFLHAHNRLRDLREPAAFGSWVCAIARRHAADHYRSRRIAEPLLDTMAAPDKPDVTTEARRVLAIIQTLPDAYRETLVLRLVEGCSGPEIAELTGLSHGSVRVNLHRGFRLLRDKLGVTA
jgi:RNA polymerase sigma-70 factor (ECF subfamily)